MMNYDHVLTEQCKYQKCCFFLLISSFVTDGLKRFSLQTPVASSLQWFSTLLSVAPYTYKRILTDLVQWS